MNTDKRKGTRSLKVISVEDISPHYRRITLGGEELVGFPPDETGGYIKLLFHNAQINQPLMRTYTIRATRLDKLEIDVDFVLHEDGGPASIWAEWVLPGVSIDVGGPGPKKLVDPTADWFLFAGDMTALPAISVNLEQLSDQARGYAVLEVPSETDMVPLAKPDGIEIRWIVNPKPGQNPDLLADAVKALGWQSGTPGIWTACEFKSMKLLRKYYMKERGIERKQFYISSYWKHGVSEDKHKQIKKVDAESLVASA